MKRSASHTFAAPIERVWAMVTEPASHVAKAERAGHENVEIIEQTIDDTGILLRLGRDVTVELPGFARRALSPRHHVESTDEWRDQGDGTYAGTFTTDFRGAPILLEGRTRLVPDGDARTTYEVEVEVAVRVPVIGRRLESWAQDDVDEQIANEFAAGDEWLAEHG